MTTGIRISVRAETTCAKHAGRRPAKGQPQHRPQGQQDSGVGPDRCKDKPSRRSDGAQQRQLPPKQLAEDEQTDDDARGHQNLVDSCQDRHRLPHIAHHAVKICQNAAGKEGHAFRVAGVGRL